MSEVSCFKATGLNCEMNPSKRNGKSICLSIFQRLHLFISICSICIYALDMHTCAYICKPTYIQIIHKNKNMHIYHIYLFCHLAFTVEFIIWKRNEKKILKARATEAAQWVKVIVIMPNGPSLTSGTHMVKRENWLVQVVLWLPDKCVAPVHSSHTQTK